MMMEHNFTHILTFYFHKIIWNIKVGIFTFNMCYIYLKYKYIYNHALYKFI